MALLLIFRGFHCWGPNVGWVRTAGTNLSHCLTCTPAGSVLSVANQGSNNVSTYAINTRTDEPRPAVNSRVLYLL